MQLQAKARLLATPVRSYKLKPVKEHYSSDMMEIGSILIEDKILKPWKSFQDYSLFMGPLPSSRDYAKGTVVIAVQRDEQVVANFLFEPLQSKFEPIKALLLKRFGLVYVPHVAIAPEYRGKGLALLIYTAMLQEGSCFWTRSHSREASELWKRVARQPGVSMVAVNPLGQIKYPEKASRGDGMLLCPTELLKS